MAIGTALLGAFQTFQAMRGLKRLQEQQSPNFSISPELRQIQELI